MVRSPHENSPGNPASLETLAACALLVAVTGCGSATAKHPAEAGASNETPAERASQSTAAPAAMPTLPIVAGEIAVIGRDKHQLTASREEAIAAVAKYLVLPLVTRVVADHGDVVEVQVAAAPDAPNCPQADADGPPLERSFFVAKAGLFPLIRTPFETRYDDGTAIAVAPGTRVQWKEGHFSFHYRDTSIAIPTDHIGLSYAVAALPELPDIPGDSGREASVPVTLNGKPFGDMLVVEAESREHLAYERGCVRAIVRRNGTPVPGRFGTGVLGRGYLAVEAGTLLRFEDGREAGPLTHPWVVDRSSLPKTATGSQRCYAHGNLLLKPLCLAADAAKRASRPSQRWLQGINF